MATKTKKTTKRAPIKSTKTREQWLNALVKQMAPWFKKLGKPLPKVRVSIGFTSAGRRGKAIGECWCETASDDGVFEIFIIPTIDDSKRVADIVAHELVHAAVGLKAKHGAAFKSVATALGLTGKMTATVAGPEFLEKIKPILAKLGPIPHAKLKPGKPKQTTRLVKCMCGECGYIVRTTEKWINDVGAPLCPCNKEEMEVC